MTWQLVTFVVLALLPFALMADFHPRRERLDTRGVPLDRTWDSQVVHEPADDQH